MDSRCLSQSGQGRPQVTERFGVIRPDRQGGAAAPDGPLKIAKGAINLGQVRMVREGVRPQSQGPADVRQGTRLVPLLIAEHAEHVMGLGVLRLARDDALVQLGGQSQLSRPVLDDRGLQVVLHGAQSSRSSRHR